MDPSPRLKLDEEAVTGKVELLDTGKPWSIYGFSESSHFFFFFFNQNVSWTSHRQTRARPSHAAAGLWDSSLTRYFNSVSAGCAVKQKYHTLCENPRSAQFLPWEIVTFCAEIGMSRLEKERGKPVSGVSKVLISFRSSRAKSTGSGQSVLCQGC